MRTNALPTPSSLTSFALAAALAAVACGGKQTPEVVVPPTPAEVTTAANRVIEQYEQGYEVVSATALTPLYLPGVETVVAVQGKVYRGSTQVEAYLQDLFTRISAFRLDLGKVAISALGDDAAEVTAELRREYRDGSATIVETGVLSMTLTRVGDKWYIRTEHFSYGR